MHQERFIKFRISFDQEQSREQVEAVQTTVKTEIKSFSEAVRQGCDLDKIATTKLEAVLKSMVSSDNQRIDLILFELDESAKEVLSS